MNAGNEEGNLFLVKNGRIALYYRKGKQVVKMDFFSEWPRGQWEEWEILKEQWEMEEQTGVQTLMTEGGLSEPLTRKTYQVLASASAKEIRELKKVGDKYEFVAGPGKRLCSAKRK